MKKVSPVRNKPILHPPGFTLRRKIFKFFFFWILGTFCPVFFFLGLLVGNGIEYSTFPTSTVALSVLFLWLVGSYLYTKHKMEPLMETLFLGRDGEAVTGEILNEKRLPNWHVYHDFEYEYAKGKKANIDHIIVAPQGVFLIETKALQKNEDELSETMFFDGKQIIFKNSGKTLPLPLEQVHAAAKALSEFLFQRTGLKVEVQKIVTYPGWYITHTPGISSTVPVFACNPSFIVSHIQATGKRILSDDDMKRICNEVEKSNRIA